VVTITPAAGQFIDGLSNKVLSTAKEAVEIISNGVNWFILNDGTTIPQLGTFLFATDQAVGNNDYIGLGTSSSNFLRNTIVSPFNGQLLSVAFSIRALSNNQNITATVWVNNFVTSLSATIGDGNFFIWNSGNGLVNVIQGDLISVRLTTQTGGAFLNGITAAVTYKLL
jgi:hypothetical protein